MLTRFSLYGFLKNQRYFEPFLVLVFLDKGLSFFEIGLLLGWRDLMVNLLEVPSGAIADGWGRRRAMITSFAAYVVSFLVFGLAEGFWVLGAAMALYAVGDAFRTGTHKAMIFTWLRSQGREDERTRVYGFTRSWSKLGSAVSSLAAMVFVLVGSSYTWVFYAAVVPYLLGIVNFLGYPPELDGVRTGRASPGQVARQLLAAVRLTLGHRGLRRLVAESMGFGGVFRASKDYLQPLLAAAAVAGVVPALGLVGIGADGLAEAQRSALLVGPVYFVLHLLSSAASRRAHRLGDLLGSQERAARVYWWVGALLYGSLIPALVLEWYGVAITGFVAIHVLNNLWRPVLIGRFDRFTPEEHGATVLSMESQAKSAAGVVLAPALGLAVDAAAGIGSGLWPVGVLGIAVCLLFALLPRSSTLSTS